jgi:hypothetical protein
MPPKAILGTAAAGHARCVEARATAEVRKVRRFIECSYGSENRVLAMFGRGNMGASLMYQHPGRFGVRMPAKRSQFRR